MLHRGFPCCHSYSRCFERHLLLLQLHFLLFQLAQLFQEIFTFQFLLIACRRSRQCALDARWCRWCLRLERGRFGRPCSRLLFGSGDIAVEESLRPCLPLLRDLACSFSHCRASYWFCPPSSRGIAFPLKSCFANKERQIRSAARR